jgi:hypothetical protein
MKLYGDIKFSTVDAPNPIGGICESFSYKTADQVEKIMGVEDLVAVILHGRKGEISFSSTPEGGVTSLVVRAGNELTITGVSGGKILVTQSSARWQRGSAMTMEAQATHYPDLGASGEGDITQGSITLTRLAGPLQLPANKVWWGVEGIEGPLAGIVQSCSISESVQVQEEEDKDGKITMLALYGYEATATIEMLTNAAKPELGEELDLFGGFRITSSEYKFQKQQMRSVVIEGLLIPGLTE